MKCIFYDGRVDGASEQAKAMRLHQHPGAKVVTRDASSWLHRPDAIEKFEAVRIPAGADFDALARAYADAGAEVLRPEADDQAAREAAARAEAERIAAEQAAASAPEPKSKGGKAAKQE